MNRSHRPQAICGDREITMRLTPDFSCEIHIDIRHSEREPLRMRDRDAAQATLAPTYFGQSERQTPS